VLVTPPAPRLSNNASREVFSWNPDTVTAPDFVVVLVRVNNPAVSVTLPPLVVADGAWDCRKGLVAVAGDVFVTANAYVFCSDPPQISLYESI
jgi:hypothetical protein